LTSIKEAKTMQILFSNQLTDNAVKNAQSKGFKVISTTNFFYENGQGNSVPLINIDGASPQYDGSTIVSMGLHFNLNVTKLIENLGGNADNTYQQYRDNNGTMRWGTTSARGIVYFGKEQPKIFEKAKEWFFNYQSAFNSRGRLETFSASSRPLTFDLNSSSLLMEVDTNIRQNQRGFFFAITGMNIKGIPMEAQIGGTDYNRLTVLNDFDDFLNNLENEGTAPQVEEVPAEAVNTADEL
jgi:hypothetical protein